MYIVKRFERMEYLAQFLNKWGGIYELVWAYKSESEIVVMFKEINFI